MPHDARSSYGHELIGVVAAVGSAVLSAMKTETMNMKRKKTFLIHQRVGTLRPSLARSDSPPAGEISQGFWARREGMCRSDTRVHEDRKEHVMPDKRPSVKNEKQYEALKEKGMSKERAARIANSPDASRHGGEKSGSGGDSRQGGTTAQKKAAGRKGGKATARKRS
jgi:hypothetical protein